MNNARISPSRKWIERRKIEYSINKNRRTAKNNSDSPNYNKRIDNFIVLCYNLIYAIIFYKNLHTKRTVF